MTAERGPRINWRQMELVKRSDKVDTRRMLLIADAYPLLKARYSVPQIAELLAVPVQGTMSAEARLREAVTVAGYWPPSMLILALEYGAVWHTLTEPPRWDDVRRDDVFAFVEEFVGRKRAWPTVGEMRRRFGRLSNHRLPGEQAGQESLGLPA